NTGFWRGSTAPVPLWLALVTPDGLFTVNVPEPTEEITKFPLFPASVIPVTKTLIPACKMVLGGVYVKLVIAGVLEVAAVCEASEMLTCSVGDALSGAARVTPA